MLRLSLVITGLVSLIAGMLLSVPQAAAQEPPVPTPTTLVNQRVELLPQEPLCWNVFRATLAPGFRGASHIHALTVAYAYEGVQPLEYPGGPTQIVRAGDGNFIGHNNWHVHANPGTTPYRATVFYLTCDDRQIPAPPVGARLAKSPTVPGIRSGPVPYEVRLIHVRWPASSQQDAPRINPGPGVRYILEGSLTLSTAEGITAYKAGELFMLPVGTPFQVANPNPAPARDLVVQLFPVGGEQPRLPNLRLPSPFTPGALPRTGDESTWAGPVVMLVGLLLTVAGIGLRRKQA